MKHAHPLCEGMGGLALSVREQTGADPFYGTVFRFRSELRPTSGRLSCEIR